MLSTRGEGVGGRGRVLPVCTFHNILLIRSVSTSIVGLIPI